MLKIFLLFYVLFRDGVNPCPSELELVHTSFYKSIIYSSIYSNIDL